MKTKAILGSLALSCALSILVCGCSRPKPSDEGPVQVGAAAPGFSLTDLKGQQLSLDQMKGKVVLLDFWATWCGPCRLSMPVLEQLQKEYGPKLALLAINLEEPIEVVRGYVQKQNLHSTILLDSEGRVGRAYGSESIPMQVVIDKEGIIRHINFGYAPNLGERLRSEINKVL